MLLSYFACTILFSHAFRLPSTGHFSVLDTTMSEGEALLFRVYIYIYIYIYIYAADNELRLADVIV